MCCTLECKCQRHLLGSENEHLRGSTQVPIHHLTIKTYTDRGPSGIGQYDSLEEYGRPRTDSSVFLVIILPV